VTRVARWQMMDSGLGFAARMRVEIKGDGTIDIVRFALPIWVDRHDNVRIGLPVAEPEHGADLVQIIVPIGELLSAIGKAWTERRDGDVSVRTQRQGHAAPMEDDGMSVTRRWKVEGPRGHLGGRDGGRGARDSRRARAAYPHLGPFEVKEARYALAEQLERAVEERDALRQALEHVAEDDDAATARYLKRFAQATLDRLPWGR